MKRVFVDSSGFFALIVKEDRAHPDELFTTADREGWELVTTNAVVFECHALLMNRSRPGRQNALMFLNLVAEDAYLIECVKKSDEERAITIVKTHEDKGYSLCDALSFVVMDRLEIKEAIAFDRHFKMYGRITTL